MDLTGWLTKNQTAVELGCSTKTVERHAERRDLTKRMRPRPGLMSEVVYDPRDVAKLKAKLAETRAAELEKVSPAVHQAEESTTALTTRQDVAGKLLAVLQSSEAWATRSGTTVPIQHRLYLSYHDAAALTGLSEATLKAAVTAGTVKTMPYGAGVRLRRKDLEAL